jgi:hypothetical protein
MYPQYNNNKITKTKKKKQLHDSQTKRTGSKEVSGE